MITSTRGRNIYLVNFAVDFRRQHDGLLAEAFKVNLNPFKGDLLIFIGRGRRKIKVLYSDETGLWLSIKKFTVETMKTRFKFITDPLWTRITSGELAMLLEGTAYRVEKKVKPYQMPNGVDKNYSPDGK